MLASCDAAYRMLPDSTREQTHIRRFSMTRADSPQTLGSPLTDTAGGEDCKRHRPDPRFHIERTRRREGWANYGRM